MNFNLVDVLVVILIGVSVFTGIKRGFIMSLFNLVGIILAFFISKEYYHIIMNFLIENTKLETSVNEFISEKIAKVIEEFGSNVTMNDLFKGFDKLPFDIRMMFNDMIASGDGSGIVSNTSSIADQVTNMIMIFISFTIALLFTFLIIFVIANVLNTIVKMPVLNLANKLLGGVFGALKTAVILYLVFALATPFIMFSDKDNTFTNMVLESKSSEIFYENNLVLNYLSYKDIIE
jgi:uncharacterized membrane protein required for colicin V production